MRVIQWQCCSSCVKIRCQEKDIADYIILKTLVSACQWSVECSHEPWVYKWAINRVTNPNPVYNQIYYVTTGETHEDMTPYPALVRERVSLSTDRDRICGAPVSLETNPLIEYRPAMQWGNVWLPNLVIIDLSGTGYVRLFGWQINYLVLCNQNLSRQHWNQLSEPNMRHFNSIHMFTYISQRSILIGPGM
jgi:hypothetical protein